MRQYVFSLIAICVLNAPFGQTESRATPPGSQHLSSPATKPTTRPTCNAIHYEEQVRTDPPMHLHLLTIDLRDPSISIRVCRAGAAPTGAGTFETTLMPVSEIAKRDGLEIAVNGNLFSPAHSLSLAGHVTPYFPGNPARVVGPAMSDGEAWSSEQGAATLVVDASGHVAIDRFTELPGDARQVVSGSNLLVSHGQAMPGNGEVAPRTAVGIDKTGNTLVILVVDGRRPDYSAGLTMTDLSKEMIRLNCWDALNLDGGGSSTMVMRDPATSQPVVVNKPSDGHDLPFSLSLERPVADALGIVWKK